MDVETITCLIKHAQISAQISDHVMSMKSFEQTPTDIVKIVQGIDSQLIALKNSLPLRLRITHSSKQEFAGGTIDIGAHYLNVAIHGSLMATNINLFYPWMSVRLGRNSDPKFRDQIAASAETIAHSARQIILSLRSFEVNVATPAWLAFYYPMYAHINLFVHTLIYPNNPSVQSDLAMLNVCAGHFAYMELVSNSTIAFHFPRDSATLAARIVKAMAGKPVESRPVLNLPLVATDVDAEVASGQGVFNGCINDAALSMDDTTPEVGPLLLSV